LTAREILEFRNIPGYGVEGVVRGRAGTPVEVRITRDPDTGFQGQVKFAGAKPPLSASYIYLDNVFSGIILVDDHVRASAPEAVARLGALGVRVSVISGDNMQATRSAASQAGIADSRGGLRPEEKKQIVAQAAHSGGEEVCMVGDGVNDAAALAAAGIGVTLGSGTEFARSSSDITIMDGDLRKLPWMVDYGKRFLNVIRWNFFWVFLYNIIGIGLAVAGRIRPVHAALAMVLSSALVIANSSRMSRAGPAGSGSVAREVPPGSR
jgi:cation transport ATPase